MNEDKKMIRRILAQTETVTITAQTQHGVTEEQAIEDLEKYVITPGVHYRNYVVSKICTEEQWKCGHVNFCPRCGTNLGEFNDDDDISNGYEGWCHECNAELQVYIQVHEDGDSQ